MVYASDLTDAQWQRIKFFFARQTFRKHSPRRIVNALLYPSKTGCQWRFLPVAYPPWQTVYYHFRCCISSVAGSDPGCGRRCCVRSAAPRAYAPGATPAPRSTPATIAIIDSQSVKTTQCGGPRGYDGGKHVTGRKRHILVDTMGFLLAILVHPASESDSQQAPWLLKRLAGSAHRLQVVFADGAYRGTPPSLVRRVFGWTLSIVRRSPEQQEFAVLPKRWCNWQPSACSFGV